jgi:hypothetical protein
MTLILPVFSIAQKLERLTSEQQASRRKAAAAGHRLSGTVTMDNHPVAKAGISVISRPTADKPSFRKMTITDEQGRWSIDKLPDAAYTVIIVPGRTLPPIGSQNGQTSESIAQFVSQQIRLEIAGGDIDDIDSRVIKGGRITGTVVMDGGESLPKDLIVLPEQVVNSEGASIRMAQVQPDGSFILENVPTGKILIKAVVFGKPTEYFMKTATLGAIDLLREPIRINDKAEIKDVYIVFAKATDK